MATYNSLYNSVLEQVKTVLDAMSELNLAGIPAHIRKRPTFEGLQDRVPQLIVASNKSMTERVEGETFEKGAILGFEVYVGIVQDARWDDETRQLRMYWREQIRLALWDTRALAGGDVGRVANVEYDPNPGVSRSTQEDLLDESWQRFTYWISTPRAN